MYELKFVNAVVKDSGYGVDINGVPLTSLISTLLGTRLGSIYGFNSGLPEFISTCCDVYISIEPKDTDIYMTDGEIDFYSFDELEGYKHEQYEKLKEANTKK